LDCKKDDGDSTQSGTIELDVKLNNNNEIVVNEEMLLSRVFEALGSQKQTIEDSV
jgi:hypothetical protein